MKYGFVYIWRDKAKDRYYIGAHWGTEDDGYICSSNWMRMSYKRRPQDFRRKILSRHQERIETFKEEDRLLKMIKKEELGHRYYNLNNDLTHWVSSSKKEEVEKKLENTQFKKGSIPWNLGISSVSEEGKNVISKANKGNKYRLGYKCSEETRMKIGLASKGRVGPNKGKKFTPEHRLSLSIAHRKIKE